MKAVQFTTTIFSAQENKLNHNETCFKHCPV